MNLKLAGASLAVALAFSPVVGDATILSSFLTFDGGSGVIGFPPVQVNGEDKLQDDSLSRLNDGGTPGISVGDSTFGILTLSEISASGTPSTPIGGSSQIAIVYAGTYAAGPAGTFTVVANPALLAATCGGVCAGAGILPGSIAVILSTTTPDTDPTKDPLNWDALGANGLTANLNGANGNTVWSWELTAGLDTLQDFFQFQGNTVLGGTNRAGLSITSSAFEADWLPVDVLDFAALLHLSDLTLDVGTNSPASAEEQVRGWTFRDQSSLFVNPDQVTVPEPGSLALLSLALAGIGGFAYRRKQ
jgi:hypothetical protein